ncbi:MAG TPA: phosphoribosylanthranilate isomerase [Longimicrobiales bacterium]|nr:phosphoribosylanthranilate isomerase [Longimicrobiales bacterium]
MGEGVRVKICGLVRREDVLVADAAGADYLGVVLSAGFGRSVDPGRAASLVEGTRAVKVAVLVDETAASGEAAARALGAEVLQLHGSEEPDLLEALRGRGEWTLWKAVRAASLADIERTVERYAPLADGILVEGWREGSLGVGGARLALDAERVRALVPDDLDFVLAGGLAPATVAEAVRRFRPDVVDVSSGVEPELGVKDASMVQAFVRAARMETGGGRGPSEARGRASAAGGSR